MLSETGEVLAQDDDDDDDIFDLSTRDSGIRIILDPGDYIVEATTYAGDATGDFTLILVGTTISQVQDACSSGTSVADPLNNPGLVSDCRALLASHDVLIGKGPDYLNWSADIDMEYWTGVTVGSSPARVTHLRLKGHGLSGKIPVELAGLSKLEYLKLEINELRGHIPAELAQLSSLWHNRLEGEIPIELAGLSKLEYLKLGSNVR